MTKNDVARRSAKLKWNWEVIRDLRFRTYDSFNLWPKASDEGLLPQLILEKVRQIIRERPLSVECWALNGRYEIEK